jgi:hypothetical protein
VHGLEARELCAQILEGIPLDAHPPGLAVRGPLDVPAARAEDGAGATAHEAVAAPLLAALDRLEQEARVAVVELAKERDRRVHVHEELADHRDEIPASGEFLERFL